jgi:endonuclease/exonuclease/phosphatase (EEP) superfamily protein YafD
MPDWNPEGTQLVFAEPGLGFTWPANRTPAVNIPIHRPLVQIDYVFYSGQWQPKYAQTLEKTGSDHLPLFTSLDLRDP